MVRSQIRNLQPLASLGSVGALAISDPGPRYGKMIRPGAGAVPAVVMVVVPF
jgi:hypothetical protein